MGRTTKLARWKRANQIQQSSEPANGDNSCGRDEKAAYTTREKGTSNMFAERTQVCAKDLNKHFLMHSCTSTGDLFSH